MLLTVLLMIIIVSLMISFNALYVAGEFAAVSARKTRVAQQARAGNRLAKALLPVLEDTQRLDNYIAASQVGITLSSIVLGIYGQRAVAPLIEPLLLYLPFLNEQAAATGLAAILILILFTTLQVIFGELIPKSLAIQYPERVALATVLPMRWSADWILRPLIVVLNGSGAVLLKLLGVGHGGRHQHVHSPEEIKLLIQQSYKGGLLDARGQELLNNAFRISGLHVGEIAVPRTNMDVISLDRPVRDALRIAVESGHTRIPVYEQDLDHIRGFVHVKDLFRLYHATGGQGEIGPIVRRVSFVPETAPVKEVWDRLQQNRNHLAIVFDEFGGTMGMVTWEDLLEELFGELRDEFDEAEEPLITSAGERVYLVRGETPISYLNSRFGLSLPTERVHTAGGLVITLLNRIPEAGDVVEIDGVQMEVEAVRRKVAEMIRLRLPRSASRQEGGN
ncbi:MAG TPA: hemolysin family protein [Candidatus Sulfomarinibacteraceae bacterium]|nr:hemolysin family protein [Candidatus Sulfomarinibacteraceae bacterium]